MGAMSTRRKLAIATWRGPREGNIYGKLNVDATAALAFIAEKREQTGQRITITHLVGKAVAQALEKEPTLNGRITFGRFVPHDTVDVTYLVSLDGGNDLAKLKIHRAGKKDIIDIATELSAGAERLRRGEDIEYEKSKGVLRRLPTWLIRPLVWLSGWLTAGLGVNMRALGLERFPFGSCIVTSVGMLGLDEAYVPPTPFARVPLYILVGAVKERPAVVDGELTVRQQFTITATLDHRFIDGFQAAVLAKTMRSVLEDPWQLENGEREDGSVE